MHTSLCSATRIVVLAALLCSSSCGGVDRKEAAQRFFRGVYGCDPSVVDDLASDHVIISYPIFERLFGVPSIRGREAVKDFATGFCERWADAQITFHESLADGDKVVLVWSFSARNVGSADEERPPTNEVHSWGGITLFHFDASGKITAEIGEESDPGPVERSATSGSSN